MGFNLLTRYAGLRTPSTARQAPPLCCPLLAQQQTPLPLRSMKLQTSSQTPRARVTMPLSAKRPGTTKPQSPACQSRSQARRSRCTSKFTLPSSKPTPIRSLPPTRDSTRCSQVFPDLLPCLVALHKDLTRASPPLPLPSCRKVLKPLHPNTRARRSHQVSSQRLRTRLISLRHKQRTIKA